MNIFVGNLNFNTTEETLTGIFQEYGTIDSLKIIMDRDTGRSRGFAFVEMSNNTEANNAIESLNGAELEGNVLRVNIAREKSERGPRNFNRTSRW